MVAHAAREAVGDEERALRTPCAPCPMREGSIHSPTTSDAVLAAMQPAPLSISSLSSPVGCVGVLGRHPIEVRHLISASIPHGSPQLSALLTRRAARRRAGSMKRTFSATSCGVSFIAQLRLRPNRQSMTEVWCVSCVLQIRTRLVHWVVCGQTSEMFGGRTVRAMCPKFPDLVV